MTIAVAATLVLAIPLVSSLGSQARPDDVGLAPASPVTMQPGGGRPGDGPAATAGEEGGGGLADGESSTTAKPQPRQGRPRPVPERVVTQAGTGELAVVQGRSRVPDTAGRLVRYRVLVEEGLTVRGNSVDGPAFAKVVHRVLTDRRGWQLIDGVAFQRVSGQAADVDVVLASPHTTDAMCEPLGTGGWLSCFNGSAAVLNARRWFSGAETYGDDVVNYRRYLVSHEMGHYLGHQHVGCPAPGVRAPVMVQQTKSLDACTIGPWPADT